MLLAHQKYLTYNADNFSRWAMSVGPMTEKVVQHFLTSGTAPEQGYKACASLTKLGERYGRERLENACGRILAYGTAGPVHAFCILLYLKSPIQLDIKKRQSIWPTVTNEPARQPVLCKFYLDQISAHNLL